MKLTQEQLEQFDREGYLFLPNLFSTEEAAFLKGEAEAIYQQDRQEVWREKSGVARTAFAAHQYNEGFRRLGSHPRLIEPVEQLLDGQVYMHQYKVNGGCYGCQPYWTAFKFLNNGFEDPVIHFIQPMLIDIQSI